MKLHEIIELNYIGKFFESDGEVWRYVIRYTFNKDVRACFGDMEHFKTGKYLSEMKDFNDKKDDMIFKKID